MFNRGKEMGMGKFIKFIFFVSVILFFIGSITAYYLDIMPLSVGLHSKVYKKSNIAMDGFDMVNYFSAKSAARGNQRFSFNHDNLGWYFISDKNYSLFKTKPNKYLPQFGGYCLYTISKGYTYPPDLKVWHLFKNKLYFFKDEETKKLALEDWKNVIENANLHWKQ